jgi:hypothetical protein
VAKNYIIGIGGTGARAIEAVVHCCAAGFGPTELSLFIVDPDEGNGNLSRTTTLVSEYQRCRESLTDRSSADVRLFGTQINTPEPFVWGIFEDQNTTLSHYINYENLRQHHRDLAEFMDVLYTPEELNTALNEGFRGHPSIGAVVMSNADQGDNPWRQFWSDVENSTGEDSVRVFLVGSIFGGTGAAGVSTFGARDMLKFHKSATIDAAQGKSKILLGSALVLPYFSIDSGDDAPADPGMHVTSSDFPIATKAALQYYNEKDLEFDQLYFIGDSLSQKVGKFAVGNVGQQNRPHYIELVTALSAFDFFAQKGPADPATQYFAAARSGRVVDWKALPVSRYQDALAPLQAELKLRIATMAVFSYAFATLGREILAQPHAGIRDPWYRSHFTFRPGETVKDPRHYQRQLEGVATYCEKFIAWISALDDESGNVQLVDGARLLAPGSTDGKRIVDYKQYGASIGALLKGDAGRGLQFHHFLNELNELKLDDASMSAPSRYVNLFYEAAYRFATDNWRMARSTPS